MASFQPTTQDKTAVVQGQESMPMLALEKSQERNIYLNALTEFHYERLDRENALLLIVDIQDGLFQLARDFDPTVYKNAALAHAAIGKTFDIPVVMTTSTENGPTGPLMQEITDMYPDAPFIKRPGEVNSWDNPDFRAAVRAAGKSQIIIAGIATDVCTATLALSLRSEGYSVWANADASGTTSTFARDITNDRLVRAGVHVVTNFAIIGDLMRDHRGEYGAKRVNPYFLKYFPLYGVLARAHAAAVEKGTIAPEE